MCVKGSLGLVLVLGWTPCLTQGVGAQPAMLRGRTAGLSHQAGWPGLRRGGVSGYNLHSQLPATVALWHTNARPGCIRLVNFFGLILFYILFLLNSEFACTPLPHDVSKCRYSVCITCPEL